MSYKFGDFSFIKGYLCQVMEEDFAIISNNNLWNALKNHDVNKPFMYDNEWDIELSSAHSGASRALSLRSFESIAKYGWDNFVKDYINKEQ